MENRRKFVRVPFYEPVGYQDNGESPLQGSVARDISQKGLKLSVHRFMALNTQMELQIRLPGQHHIVPASGQVIWIRELPYRDDAWEVGVRLVSNSYRVVGSSESTLTIRDYIDRCLFAT